MIKMINSKKRKEIQMEEKLELEDIKQELEAYEILLRIYLVQYLGHYVPGDEADAIVKILAETMRLINRGQKEL
ncbi:MAG: hypothetical protein QXV17_09260 [Candidatus Micrarchaeaceae archaeon]